MDNNHLDINRWFVVINPVAGKGKGLSDYPQISKLLRDADILCESVFTERKFHAVELAVDAIKRGHRKIIVVGGDGTLHEVVNGIFIQKEVKPTEILLAVIAVGTGNDWARSFGTPTKYSDAIRSIKAENSFIQDVGAVSYEESHFRQTRYMANVSGAGFDAMVQREFMHLRNRGKTTKWDYVWSMFRAFFKYKPTGVKVWVDDELIYNNLLFSAAIGICKFNGGGMQQLPEAVADDGLLDISLIKPIHFWHILFRMRLLFNGGFYRIRHVVQARGAKIRIESTPEISVEVDGELLGQTPLEFTVLHQAIRIVVSEDFYLANVTSR
ncbi:MAG: diacylglycerol kinase family protein [Rikenellaceae bacterium]